MGWINDVAAPAIIWYTLNLIVSYGGFRLYLEYHPGRMNTSQLTEWYRRASIFFLLIFSLWTLIFVLYVTEERGHLNYIAIFTQIGASVVAATLLSSDKRLFITTLLFLLIPMSIFFAMIGELYGYILAIFTLVLLGVLGYAAYSSYTLLEKSSYQATHDYLTGLFNRRYFISFLKQKVRNLAYAKQYSFMMLIDLDHFKTINDSLGHDIGDKLLKIVSSRIQQQIGRDQLLARLGGDEFVIVSQNIATKKRRLTRRWYWRESFSACSKRRLSSTYIISTSVPVSGWMSSTIPQTVRIVLLKKPILRCTR